MESLKGLRWFYRKYSEWKELSAMRQALLASILGPGQLTSVSPDEVHS